MAASVYTVTRLEPDVAEWLRTRAALEERSIAAELRLIIRAARQREADAEREQARR
jgi:plasmid stability protein